MTNANETHAFNACGNKGVRFAFPNGWEVSIQWGPGNYAEGMPGGRYGDMEGPRKAFNSETLRGCWHADSAEVAVFKPSGDFLSLGYDTVAGYVTVDKVPFLLSTVCGMERKQSDCEATRAVCEALGWDADDIDDDDDAEPNFVDLVEGAWA